MTARICELASSLVASHPRVAGVAVASAGVVDPSTGDIVSPRRARCPEAPGLSASGKATGLKVRVLNDVHARGLGERRRSAPASPTAPSCPIAVGTTASVVPSFEDRQVFFGSRGIAGHVDHFAPDAVLVRSQGTHRVLLLRLGHHGW